MRFVIATKDYSGLGFAIRLQDEGHEVLLACNPDADEMADPARRAAFEMCGNGMVKKAPLCDLLSKRDSMRDWYWVWDNNHSVDENELLRREGFKVFAGGEHANCMEHDRKACLEFASRHGLQPPPSFEFSDTSTAIEFCKKHRRTAYVYKPDEGANFETFLPESEDPLEANEELRTHLGSIEPKGNFILQERKEGVETNVEVWFVNGAPKFAFMGIECKRKCAKDLGELVGCALDYAFVIPLDSRAVVDSVGKLFPAYREMNYTGFSDANFIAAKDGIWFFEKCERFGYNAHPNLFFNLALQGTGEIIASLVDGTFEPRFSGGFGATVTMSTKENPVGGKAIQFNDRVWKDIFWWDVYRKDDLLLTAGYDTAGYVLIVCGYGYTMPTAWEDVMKKADQIKFPYRQYRPDGDGVHFPSSPIRRYEALKAMNYI